MTTTTTNELTNGRWLGNSPNVRGIFCHHAPDVEDINPEPGEVVFHTMSTSVADWADVRGELIRWVCDGEVGYEVRINGSEEHGGICDIAAYTLNDLWALAKVTNDLRYMWEAILDPAARGAWSTWSGRAV
jgi:hypothetical protein